MRNSTRLFIGAVSILAGVVALALPSSTLLFLGVLFGVQLVLVGMMRLWALRAFVLPPGRKAVGYVLACLTVLAGVVCILRPGSSLVLVAVFLGAGWVADGAVELVAASTGSMDDRGPALLNGALTVLGGIVVLVFPRTSLVTLAQVAGVILLLFGIAYVASGVTRWRASMA